MTRATSALLAGLVGILLAMTSAPAFAAPSDDAEPDPQITAMLEEVPGGVLIDSRHAVWPELAMELTVHADKGRSARSVGSCATNSICVYNGLSLGGTSTLTFGTCGNHTIPSTFSAKSLANARTSGYVQARNGSAVVATVYAGNWANISGGATSLRCYL
ncbi:hypothetical protein [Microbacterium sp. LWH11-1.2]|uniref:hypothetical protein n=1 Tax=Microbacterium sp. LWH11-1.2 TaxID=3135258 RepID=UPI00313A42DD